MIQDNYVPASVEKKTERIAAEKKQLEAKRAEKKELIKKRREEWKSKGKKYHDLIDIFTNEVNEYEDKDNFIDAKNEYTTKRDAIIESALRLVKKIVNNEEEYNIFYNNYYGKN